MTMEKRRSSPSWTAARWMERSSARTPSVARSMCREACREGYRKAVLATSFGARRDGAEGRIACAVCPFARSTLKAPRGGPMLSRSRSSARGASGGRSAGWRRAVCLGARCRMRRCRRLPRWRSFGAVRQLQTHLRARREPLDWGRLGLHPRTLRLDGRRAGAGRSEAAVERWTLAISSTPAGDAAEIEECAGCVAKGLDILLRTRWVDCAASARSGLPVHVRHAAAFLDAFGLGAISDLPGLDDLRGARLPRRGRRPSGFPSPSPATTDRLDADEDIRRRPRETPSRGVGRGPRASETVLADEDDGDEVAAAEALVDVTAGRGVPLRTVGASPSPSRVPPYVRERVADGATAGDRVASSRPSGCGQDDAL